MSRPGIKSSADFQSADDRTTPLARWPVPENWRWVSANQIARIVGGGTPPSRDEANFCSPGAGIPWITPADLTGYSSPYIEHGRRNITEEGLANCGAKLVPAGSVLLSSRAPIGYCAIASNPVATSQGFKSLVFSNDISPVFIRSYLKHSREYLHTLASGTTFPEISGRRVGEISIPLPPLAEQRRIVERLESLEARSRRARAKLAAVPAQLTQARQSLLANAFRGELTSDWRKSNSVGEWISGTLKDFVRIRYGKGMPVSDLSNEGFPVFGANGIIGFTDSFHFEEPQVLISCRGAYSGKVNWSPPRCFITNNSLSVVPIDDTQIHRHWLYYALCGSDTSRMVTGSAQPQVTITNAEVLEISIPPLPEQHEIVRRLSGAFARLDAVEAAHDAAVAGLNRLDQSILIRAFAGRLT